MTAPLTVRYRFDLPDGSQRALRFAFDPTDFRLINAPPAEPPFWTELAFSRCANCPLAATTEARCPVAVQMVDSLDALQGLVSFDTVRVTVIQAERTVHAETSAQQALSSVLGLIMATAGCPWTDHLRPMARFHLPFASESETIYRTVSMYLLAKAMAGAEHFGGFAALEKLYDNLHVVNRDMSRRLGAATRTDPPRNAIALLDTYTLLLPTALDSSMSELEPLFHAWRSGGLAAI